MTSTKTVKGLNYCLKSRWMCQCLGINSPKVLQSKWTFTLYVWHAFKEPASLLIICFAKQFAVQVHIQLIFLRDNYYFSACVCYKNLQLGLFSRWKRDTCICVHIQFGFCTAAETDSLVLCMMWIGSGSLVVNSMQPGMPIYEAL